jgi:hypothetical protein
LVVKVFSCQPTTATFSPALNNLNRWDEFVAFYLDKPAAATLDASGERHLTK